MATTQNIFQPTYVRSLIPSAPPLTLGGPEAPEFKETAGQTWGVGDLLYQDSNGTLAICTTGSTLLTSKVCAIANKAATGVTGASVWAHAITPWDVFQMNVYHATPASSVTAQTNLGAAFGIILIGGVWRVDVNNAVEGNGNAKGYLTCVGFPYRAIDGTLSTIGDTHGLMLVRFNEMSLSADGLGLKRLLQYA